MLDFFSLTGIFFCIDFPGKSLLVGWEKSPVLWILDGAHTAVGRDSSLSLASYILEFLALLANTRSFSAISGLKNNVNRALCGVHDPSLQILG